LVIQENDEEDDGEIHIVFGSFNCTLLQRGSLFGDLGGDNDSGARGQSFTVLFGSVMGFIIIACL